MPEAEIRKRGGAKRWRTIRLPNGKYIHVAIVRKRGKRGGKHTSQYRQFGLHSSPPIEFV